MLGYFVRSKAGHDKGSLYMILKEDDTYVYLVDGKNKLVDAPKKKKWIHVQKILKVQDEFIIEKLSKGNIPTNDEIKKAIKNYDNMK